MRGRFGSQKRGFPFGRRYSGPHSIHWIPRSTAPVARYVARNPSAAVELCSISARTLAASENAIADSAATDAETTKAYVQGFADAGCDELIMVPCDADPEQVDLLADAVL